MLLLIMYLHHPKINICSCGTVDLGTEKSKRSAYAKRETMTVHLKLCSGYFWRPHHTAGISRSEILTLNPSFYLQVLVLFLFSSSVELVENSIFPENDSEPGSCFLFISFTVVVFNGVCGFWPLFENKFWLSQPLIYYCYLGGNILDSKAWYSGPYL